MATLKEEATNYTAQTFKNIADLEAVSVQQEIKTETKVNSSNEEYTVSFMTINNEKYRVPKSVMEQLQAILRSKPEVKTIKVEKKGENLNTTYQVIALE